MVFTLSIVQTDNHASTSSLDFLQAGCSSGSPTDSVKALKKTVIRIRQIYSKEYNLP